MAQKIKNQVLKKRLPVQPFFVILISANREELGANPKRARRRKAVVQNGHVATRASRKRSLRNREGVLHLCLVGILEV